MMCELEATLNHPPVFHLVNITIFSLSLDKIIKLSKSKFSSNKFNQVIQVTYDLLFKF